MFSLPTETFEVCSLVFSNFSEFLENVSCMEHLHSITITDIEGTEELSNFKVDRLKKTAKLLKSKAPNLKKVNLSFFSTLYDFNDCTINEINSDISSLLPIINEWVGLFHGLGIQTEVVNFPINHEKSKYSRKIHESPTTTEEQIFEYNFELEHFNFKATYNWYNHYHPKCGHFSDIKFTPKFYKFNI